MDTKIRILAIERMMSYNGITLKEIQSKLFNDYSIKVERKAVYDDIYTLTMFMNIQFDKKTNRYYIERI